MKGLDTNVIVRFPTQDGPGKSPVATRFILQECKSTEPGFINRVVPCELVWILDSGFGLPVSTGRGRRRNGPAARTAGFEIEDVEAAWSALAAYATGGADFADGLVGRANADAGCETTVTLDRGAAKSAGFQLLA